MPLSAVGTDFPALEHVATGARSHALGFASSAFGASAALLTAVGRAAPVLVVLPCAAEADGALANATASFKAMATTAPAPLRHVATSVHSLDLASSTVAKKPSPVPTLAGVLPPRLVGARWHL